MTWWGQTRDWVDFVPGPHVSFSQTRAEVAGVTYKPASRLRRPVPDLTPDRVAALADRYGRESAFYLVERDRLDTLPGAVRDDALVWKDAEWIVRWYFRRHLDEPRAGDRAEVETAFRENPWGEVRASMLAAVEADDLDARVGHLTDLEGVTVPVATAFLFFMAPDRDIVLGPREWDGLRRAHEVDRPYPSRPDVGTYATYRRRCTDIAERTDVDLVTLQRALWQLGAGSSNP